MSNFRRGVIYWSMATNAHPVLGGIMYRYAVSGGPPAIGLPVSDEVDVPGRAGARMSSFERGRVYWSMATDAHLVQGGILTRFDQLGGVANLGLPTTDETDVPGRTGARMSSFERGRVYWSMATDAHSVVGGIMAKYLIMGGAGGNFGLPLSDEFYIAGGRRSNFQGGHITWDSTSGDVKVFTR
jgi:uncharacterized protein with LGFP repeats